MFREALDRLQKLGQSVNRQDTDENENEEEYENEEETVSQDDVISILRPKSSGKFNAVVARAHCLVDSGEMAHSVFEEQVRVSAIAMIGKLLEHQDAEKRFETPYGNDMVLHTNVPVESFFGVFDNLDIRFRNMAKTTVCQTAVAHFNKTDNYVQRMEAIEVDRILASRRHSRQNERIDELFQLNERHRARLARHENVS